jgi:hypothetical protein
MTIELLVFGFGGLLLLLSLIGGGFEVKELKIPKVGWGTRLCSGALGLIFVLMGLGLTNQSAKETPIAPAIETPAASVRTKSAPVPVPAPVPAPAPEPRTQQFTIYTELDPGQLNERANIWINQVFIGTIYLDIYRRNGSLVVTVPPGNFHYMLEIWTTYNAYGQPVELYGSGQGWLRADPNATYIIRGQFSGQQLIVGLVEVSR